MTLHPGSLAQQVQPNLMHLFSADIFHFAFLTVADAKWKPLRNVRKGRGVKGRWVCVCAVCCGWLKGNDDKHKMMAIKYKYTTFVWKRMRGRLVTREREKKHQKQNGNKNMKCELGRCLCLCLYSFIHTSTQPSSVHLTQRECSRKMKRKKHGKIIRVISERVCLAFRRSTHPYPSWIDALLNVKER